MKLLQTLCVLLLLAINSFAEEPNWDALRGKLQKTLGRDWTVASDFNSFIAIRRNVKVLNTISRPDQILSNSDSWDKADASDYIISIVVRPKLSQKEYKHMERLRREWIVNRSNGVTAGSKDAHTFSVQAEDAIPLPDYYFATSSVYVSTSVPNFFMFRPDTVTVDRDRLLAILHAECHTYKSEPEQDAP